MGRTSKDKMTIWSSEHRSSRKHSLLKQLTLNIDTPLLLRWEHMDPVKTSSSKTPNNFSMTSILKLHRLLLPSQREPSLSDQVHKTQSKKPPRKRGVIHRNPNLGKASPTTTLRKRKTPIQTLWTILRSWPRMRLLMKRVEDIVSWWPSMELLKSLCLRDPLQLAKLPTQRLIPLRESRIVLAPPRKYQLPVSTKPLAFLLNWLPREVNPTIRRKTPLKMQQQSWNKAWKISRTCWR